MIAIHSSVSDDSTNNVLDWLKYLTSDESIIHLCDTTQVNQLAIFIGGDQDNADSIQVNGIMIDIAALSASWYRRGEFVLSGVVYPPWAHVANMEGGHVLRVLDGLIFPDQSSVNRFGDVFINKLQCLRLARSLGLDVPDTLITTVFSTLTTFSQRHGDIILKPIGTPFFAMPMNERFIAHVVNKVSLVGFDELDACRHLYPDNLMQPTFAQQYVEKKWEIRSFYLKGKFYSMAIFSQQNERTQIDFRNYDDDRPNRCLPFILPKIMEDKLSNLMGKLNMNSGSFDIIYTPDKRYVFLEVNPVGQYQWLSENCNYFLDKIIAETLLNLNRNEHRRC